MTQHSDGSTPLRHPTTEHLLRYFEYEHLPAHL